MNTCSNSGVCSTPHFTCYNCDGVISLSVSRCVYSEIYQEAYCEDCYGRLFSSCLDCTREIYSGAEFCESCFYMENEPIKNYHYVPFCGLVFHGEGSLFFGLEVEVEFRYSTDRDNYIEKLLSWSKSEFGDPHKFVIPQRDGSLSYARGVELVFQPQSIMKLEENFSKMPHPKYDELVISDDVGIHVNISRDALTTEEWARFTRFMFLEESFWRGKSGRDSSEWAKFSGEMNVNLSNPEFPREKYSAIRFGYDRVEVRTFISLLRKDRLLEVSRLCFDLVNFSKSISNEDFAEFERNGTLLWTFKKFMETHIIHKKGQWFELVEPELVNGWKKIC